MLAPLQQFLRTAASRGRSVTRVGPFLVTINEGTDHPFLNYAIPDDAAVPSEEDVRGLVAAFASAGRVPRLEYLERCAPAVLPALEAAGFTLEGNLRAMTTTETARTTVPAGFRLAAPESDADVAAMLSVQAVAFGGPPEVTPEAVARVRTAAADGAITLAVFGPDGVVGGAGASPVADGFVDVGGIAVTDGFRRRGLATALTAEITRRGLAAGASTAFLTPADDGAAEVYRRAGYAEIGRMLHVRRG